MGYKVWFDSYIAYVIRHQGYSIGLVTNKNIKFNKIGYLSHLVFLGVISKCVQEYYDHY